MSTSVSIENWTHTDTDDGSSYRVGNTYANYGVLYDIATLITLEHKQ